MIVYCILSNYVCTEKPRHYKVNNYFEGSNSVLNLQNICSLCNFEISYVCKTSFQFPLILNALCTTASIKTTHCVIYVLSLMHV